MGLGASLLRHTEPAPDPFELRLLQVERQRCLRIGVLIKVISLVATVQPMRGAIEIHMIGIVDVDTGAGAKIALLIVTKKLPVIYPANFWRFFIAILPINPV